MEFESEIPPIGNPDSAKKQHALEATARRLQVMAEVYDHLSLKQDSRSVNMRFFLTDVVEKVFQSLAPSGPVAFQVICEDEDVYLRNDHALAIGIIANELVTNSLKYAFPGDAPGPSLLRSRAERELSCWSPTLAPAFLQQPIPAVWVRGSSSSSPNSSTVKSTTNGSIRVCAFECGRIPVDAT
nr:sensor histidine kinase [Bradyrhizobium sp. BRP22]